MTFLELQNPIHWFSLTHVIAGAIALITLSVPLLSKKGGSLHTKAGWIYVGAMVFVGLSSFVITSWRIFFDPKKTSESEAFSIFLFYIAIFTLSAIIYGLSSLREKHRTIPNYSLFHLGPPILTVFFGLIVQVIGYHLNSILLLTFPLIGHLNAKSQIHYWTNTPKEKMHWWYAHMNGMIVACIATITAFLVTAIPRIWNHPIAASPILWIAPGVILGFILNRWTTNFKSTFEQ